MTARSRRAPSARAPAVSAVLATTLTLAAPGCDPAEPAAPGPAFTVSDSAGIPVVENRRPALPPERAWRIEAEPVAVFGRPDAPGKGDFGRPVDARFLRDGGVVVADGGLTGWQFVVVFDPDGTPRASCGGAGERPDRLRRLAWAAAWPGDSVAAYDAADRSITVYPLPTPERVRWSGPGSPGREMECDPGRELLLGGSGALPSTDGTVIVAATDSAAPAADSGKDVPGVGGDAPSPRGSRPATATRVGPAGESLDSLGRFPWPAPRARRARPGPGEPFQAEPRLAATPDGLVHAPGRPFEVRLFGRGGRLERVIRREWTPDPVTAADRERWVAWRSGRRMSGAETSSRESRERLLRELRWPPAKPAVSRVILADDGAIWVEGWRWEGDEVPPDPEPTTWSVFAPTGRWLTDVEVPGSLMVTDVRGDRLVGIRLDEGGTSEVRVHRLVR